MHLPHPPPPPAKQASAHERPRRLLTQNSRLRRIGVWNWTLPALGARLPDGRTISTCPAAGACASICYARYGAYTWPDVRAKHLANLAFVIEDPRGWEQAMLAELASRRLAEGRVRIHDAGDFFSDPYLERWISIIRARPNVFFYCYTKEVLRFQRLVEPQRKSLPNFLWAYSLGGRQDNCLDPQVDRVADVFPTDRAIEDAGWHPQTASDLLAVLGPAPVGMVVNNHPTAKRRLGNHTLGQLQAERDRRARDRRSQASSADHDPS
ncbi:hypothetical protein OHA25_60600 (plasmid) [Nonomuraea sp. NBC_00507]|uniref:GP88 family protein n=1 Tax=Nonomuraea sp. NBC_00507 TaxID=2976002 RepID=UPI002E17D6F4